MSYQIRPQHILVVDDEPTVQEALEMLLIHHGHTVDLASDGLEALQKLSKKKFDVVFTDLNMPEMRGDEVASRIRKKDPHQAIVMISAYSNLLTPRQRKEIPVDFFLGKPFQLASILDALKRAHEINESNRKNAESLSSPPTTSP